MTTIKTLPWGVSPAKYSSGKIILDGCCFDETKHPVFHDKYRDIQKYCLPDTIGVDTEFIYSNVCHCPNEDGSPPLAGIGLGRLNLKDGVYTLEREQTLFTGNSNIGRVPYLLEGVKEIFHENAPLVVSTFEASALDSHLFKNALPYHGGYVRLTEEGILFSSKGHITKITPQELVKYISQSSASISTGPISIKPLKTKPGRPKKGTIIFNEVSKKFEGYDGTEWRTIKWED